MLKIVIDVYFLMKRNSVHFSSSRNYSPSKKKRHRIKIERAGMATKIHEVPFHHLTGNNSIFDDFVYEYLLKLISHVH